MTSTELDFAALRSSMKTFLSSQDRLRDYDFDGSNMSVLLDLLAWNTHLQAHYLNLVGSEMFLDTARLDDSLYSHSKELNYAPRSVTSARTEVVLTIDTDGDSPATVTVPKYYALQSAYTDDAGVRSTYEFLTLESVVVEADETGAYVSSNVAVAEGELVRDVFVANGTSRYVLSSANVDTSTLDVVVQTSSSDTSNVAFTRAYNLYGLTSVDPVYFVQGAYDGRFEVTFGDGVVGKEVVSGNLVRVTYLSSSGEAPNGARSMTAAADVDGYSVSATALARATGGAPREDADSIRFNAPRHFATQERAVVKYDFISLVREKFPQLQAVTAYGGEEVVPKRYGKIILSVKPYGDTVVSDRVKSDVIDYLTGKNIITEPVIIDADFLYLKVDCRVVYDKDVTVKTEEQIRTLAKTAIAAYSSGYLDDFGVDFRRSRLERAVDDCDPSVVSNDTEVEMIKKWSPPTGSTQSTVFTFGNQLRVETRESDLEHHDPIVRTSQFTYRKNGVNYLSVVQDDGDGTLVLYTLDDDGTKIVLENDVGSVDYDTGDVTLSVNAYSYSSDSIDVYGVPELSDVEVRANLFLTIDDADVTVTVERLDA